jgi:hypothetical protein
VFKLPVTALRSSSRVVVGTTGAATGATSTGVEVTTVFAAAFAALPFAAGLGVSTTGADTGAGAAASFFATALTGLAVLEAAGEFICIPEDKEVLEGIIRRFLDALLIYRVINFGKLSCSFFIPEDNSPFSF